MSLTRSAWTPEEVSHVLWHIINVVCLKSATMRTYLFWLLCRLQLECDLLLCDQVYPFVDLAEPSSADFLGHLPSLFHDVARLEQVVGGGLASHPLATVSCSSNHLQSLRDSGKGLFSDTLSPGLFHQLSLSSRQSKHKTFPKVKRFSLKIIIFPIN